MYLFTDKYKHQLIIIHFLYGAIQRQRPPPHPERLYVNNVNVNKMDNPTQSCPEHHKKLIIHLEFK